MPHIITLGDPHLGKKFEAGVPLHRRGDREKLQWQDFAKSLNSPTGPGYHVNMGDMFDRWHVSYDVIYRAAELYREAAAQHPTTEYVILQGNHDASRDLERVSAFHLFAGLVRGLSNITVVAGEPHFSGSLGFIPWSPVCSAVEFIELHAADFKGVGLVFGHWDVIAIGDTSNLLPAAQLYKLGVRKAITGHDHTARQLTMDGIDVTVTGSMQPYSHAEDSDGKLYVTRTLEEYLADPSAYRDKCLRLQLQKGEALDHQPDVLQLKIVYEIEEDTDDGEVEFSEFNFDLLFNNVMEEAQVAPQFIEAARARWENERSRTS